MVERFVEIDARVFLDGTLTSRRGFQLTAPVLYSGFPPVLVAVPSAYEGPKLNGHERNFSFFGSLRLYSSERSVVAPVRGRTESRESPQ